MSIDAARAHRLAVAGSGDEVVAALRDFFEADAEVFVVDHATDRLNTYDGRHGRLLDGGLRTDVLALRTSHHDGRWWIPIPERDQPVFVVSVASAPDRLAVSPHTLGMLLAPLRERFESLERLRRGGAMSVAAEYQWDLLPVRADHGCGTSVASVLEPAYDVAGDLFDHSFDHATSVYSFDGMGHGLLAATHASAALAAVRNRRREGGGLTEQFAMASSAVRESSRGSSFVTAIGCEISPGGEAHVVNAGHEPVRLVRDGRVTRLDLDADPPLGVGTDSTFATQSIGMLEVGDGLVVLSDGAAAARTAHGGRLGGDRVDEILSEWWSDVPLQTAQDIAAGILSATVDEVADDITIVIVRRDGPTTTGAPR